MIQGQGEESHWESVVAVVKDNLHERREDLAPCAFLPGLGKKEHHHTCRLLALCLGKQVQNDFPAGCPGFLEARVMASVPRACRHQSIGGEMPIALT